MSTTDNPTLQSEKPEPPRSMRWAWTVDKNSKRVIAYENGEAFYALFSDGGEGDFVGLGKAAIPTKTKPFWPITRWRSPRRLPVFARRRDPVL